MRRSEDFDLVKRIRKGDHEAFEILYRKYFTKVYNSCRKILRDHESAEEAANLSLLRIWETKSPWNNKSQFSSWLYRVTQNEAFMALRKRNQHEKKIISMENLRALKVAADPDLNRHETKHLQKALRSAISSLSEHERLVFELRYCYDFGSAEIAASLGLSISAVKSRLHRSLLTVRRRLARAEAHHWLSAANG